MSDSGYNEKHLSIERMNLSDLIYGEFTYRGLPIFFVSM